jgi:three-Cys-motif partner protein
MLAAYCHEFGEASRGAGRWYFVDGFAGPGINVIRGSGVRALGSPLIALRTDPEFRRAVLLEQNRIAHTALRARTVEFGDRALAERGNANTDLLDLMRLNVDRHHPVLCVLDPEGADLEWSTIMGIADFKRGLPHKAEQLILLPTDAGFMRELPISSGAEPTWSGRDLDRIFGNTRWRRIYDARRAGNLTPDQARGAYVQLLADGIVDLGYGTVLVRPILRHGRTGAVLYFMIFATDSEDGRTTMDRCFETVFGGKPAPA